MAGSSAWNLCHAWVCSTRAGLSEVPQRLIHSKIIFVLSMNTQLKKARHPSGKWQYTKKAYTGRQLPGSEQWGVEEFDQSLYPKAGGVLGRSSSSGKRAFMAQTVRYYIPEKKTKRIF